jgi:hypothetical protein
MLEPYFAYVALAENSVDIMSECISELISENGKDLIFDPREDLGRLMPSPAQRALVNAVRRLRPGNVQFLLSVGARVLPGQFSSELLWDLARNLSKFHDHVSTKTGMRSNAPKKCSMPLAWQSCEY